MAQTKTIMTAQGTPGPGPQHTLHPEECNRGYVVSAGGVSAAVTASVNIEVSCDQGVTWATRMLFKISGTASLSLPVTNSDVDPNGPFPLVRANVLALTGGALITVSVCSAYSGGGAA